MPKIIENLRQTILDSAQSILLQSGYAALTIRKVACASGIAVGTVYNYFPSKELLAAAVMLEDWQEALAVIRAACEKADDIRTGLAAAYGEVSAFSRRYQPSWSGYSFRGSQQSDFRKRHRMLVRQLAGCLSPLLPPQSEALSLFLAENVLVCVDGSELSFEELLEILRPVLGAGQS
jgi:AcrR family transcriptional regulator